MVQDEASREVLQSLADSLKAEHIPSLKRKMSGKAYHPSEAEMIVAVDFAKAHKCNLLTHDQNPRQAVLRSRQRTTDGLCQASNQLNKELAKVCSIRQS